MGKSTRIVVPRIAEILTGLGAKIAVAESVTAGMIQSRLASVSGSSAYFLGGVVTYALQQKVELLHVDREHAQAVNCVSQRVSEEMAAGVGKMFRADLTMAITGYAESSDEMEVERPHAHVAIWRARPAPEAVSGGSIIRYQRLTVDKPRVKTQRAFARRALRLLLESLELME